MSASCSDIGSMLTACKLAVSDALEYDSRGATLEAYVKYLSCCLKITSSLLQETKAFAVGFGESRLKMIKLAQQCLDRVAGLCCSLDSSSSTHATAGETIITAKPAAARWSAQDESNKQHLLHPGQLNPQFALYQQNQLLVKAHQERAARLLLNPASAATMSLSLHRKLVENAALAKARQSAIDLRLRQKWERMQELAEQRISVLQSKLNISENKDEQKALLAAVMMYEDAQQWTASWRTQLCEKASDSEFVHELCITMLRHDGHPLRSLLLTLQADAIALSCAPIAADNVSDLIDSIVAVPYHSEERRLDTAMVDVMHSEEDPAGHKMAAQTRAYASSKDADISSAPVIVDCHYRDLGNSNVRHPVMAARLSPTNCPSGESTGPPPGGSHELDASSEQLSITASTVTECSANAIRDEFDELFDSSEDSDNGNESHQKTVATASPPQLSRLGKAEEERNRAVWLAEVCSRRDHLSRQLEAAVEQTQMALQHLLQAFGLVYEELGSPPADDSVRAAIEEEFFAAVHAPLFLLFRLANLSSEINAAMAMTKYEGSSMDYFGVKSQWQQLPDGKSTSRPVTCSHYSGFGDTLARLSAISSPRNKLACAVLAHKQLCNEIQTRYSSAEPGKSLSLGADDLLPIICYLTAKSKMPSLVSEFQFMEHFISERCLLDEEGYCLSTLQAALEYVISLERDGAVKS